MRSSPQSFRASLPQLGLLALVFFFAFSARIAFSPLLPSIEADLGLSHARSTSFFLFMTAGYSAASLLSGLLSARIGHRWTILAATFGASAALLLIARSSSLALLRVGLVLLGVSGLYIPSAIPSITALVARGDEARALAVHELAPNLAFVLIPLLAAALLSILPWRAFLLLMALAALASGLAFLAFGRGGRFRGEPPSPANVRLILSRPSFWVIASLFALGAGSGVGVFAVIPTYLVAERGMDQALVNTLLGLSRISGLAAVFLAGWLADRFGARVVLAAVLVASGAATAALGSGRGGLLLAAVFAQPVLTACFFPVGFAAIARITPRRIYNVTVSFVLPISYTLGGGVVPALMGVLGDRGAFASGFLLFGALMAAGSLLVLLLRLEPA